MNEWHLESEVQSRSVPSEGISRLGGDIFLPSFFLYYSLKGICRECGGHEMCPAEDTVLLGPHPFYVMPLQWEEEKGKNKEKKILPNRYCRIY